MPRNKRNSKRRGSAYELKICNELKELTGLDIKTSRSESKELDNNKVDLVCEELGFYPQIKKTQNAPNYFDIESECPLKGKPFVIFWNKTKPTESTFRSVGEIVMIPKDYFYKLIKLELDKEKGE